MALRIRHLIIFFLSVFFVWFGWATPLGLATDVQHFAGDRAAVRAATVAHALQGLVRSIA